MLQYSRLQLATIIAVPIVTIILLWTVIIFYKNKKYWKCFDTAIVAVLTQSILRNLAIISYTILQMVNQSSIRFEYCTVFVWVFNSIHTFQASTLSTLSVIALFSIKLYRKQEHLKNYLTVAHVVYHLFCLTTLCACVGVAAILAKQKNKEFVVIFDFFPLNLCKFMPYEMDIKYNVFIITLHTFLAFISLIAFMLTCYNFYACKKDCFAYVKKSDSDLSELSIGSTSRTYQMPYYEGYATGKIENGQVQTNQGHWTSDTSNISTTVSSTNSRRPCLGKQMSEEETEGVGLETILPILTVCYLFNHVPVIVLCLFPWFIAPWSVATVALCLGLLQDILVPLSLGLVDTRFCQWISNVYRCSDRERLNDKLPQVGLDGKFRPFGTHSPEAQVAQLSPERQKSYHITGNEPKFPITNGSLYTSVDGRVPIIHNYRRHKDRISGVKPVENNLINLGVHATYLKQQDLQTPITISTVKPDYICSSRVERKPPVAIKKRVSLSQNGLNRFGIEISSHKTNIGPLRLSKSEDSLCEIERSNLDHKTLLSYEKNELSDSEDDYFSDSMNVDTTRNSDDESGKSSFSITTEANCDFEFYQAKFESRTDDDFISSHSHETFEYLRINSQPGELKENIPVLQTFKPQLIPRISTSKDNITVVSMECIDKPKIIKLDVNRNFKITRSNSKRSLENFKAFVDDTDFDSCDNIISHNQTQRSYSYIDLDDTIKFNNKFESAWIGLDSSYSKDVCKKQVNPSRSVPDLKKIFISDYL